MSTLMRFCLVILPCMICSLSASDAVSATTPPVVQGSVFSIVVDADGNQYIAGVFSGVVDFNPYVGEDLKTASGGSDAFVTRYNADWTYAWTRTLGGSGVDGAYAMCLAGNTVYVTGSFNSNNFGIDGGTTLAAIAGDDAFIVALNRATGSEVWKQKFGGNGGDNGRAIAVSDGYVMAGGYFNSSNAGIGGTGALASVGDWDCFMIAVSATDGSPSWARSFASAGYEIALGATAGNRKAYFTGEFSLTSSLMFGASGSLTSTGGSNAFIIAMDIATGTADWLRQFGGSSGNDVGRGIHLRGNRVYVTGNFEAPSAGLGGSGTLTNSGSSNAWILALDTAGNEIWKQKFGGTDSDNGVGVAADADAVFVTGALPSSDAGIGGIGPLATTGGEDAFVIALSPVDGSEIWKQKWGGSNNDVPQTVVVFGDTLWCAGGFLSSNAGIGGVGNASANGFGGFKLPLDTLTGKGKQRIYFPHLPIKGEGDADFAPGASSSAGLALTYTSSDTNVATIVSGTIHIVGAGTSTITAIQSGTSNYLPAQAQRTLTVAQIVLNGLQQTYDGTPKSVTATTNPLGLSVDVTYNGSNTAPIGAGSYLVVATITTPGLSGSSTGTLVIAKAVPEILWNNPADISAGTALSATQLNAVSQTAGSFSYFPAAGTVLSAGANQMLAVVFSPSDTANFESKTKTVAINITNAAPVIASAPIATPNPAIAGESIQFTASASDANDSSLTYSWAFGDGNTGSGSSVSHSYGAGTYNIILTVTDTAGASATAAVALVVKPFKGAAGIPPELSAVIDSDGDGFSDLLEAELGTSSLNAADTPFGGEPAGSPLVLTDLKLSISLSFIKSDSDRVSMSGTVMLPAGSLAGKKLAVTIGSIRKSFTLDGKGAAAAGRDTARVTSKRLTSRSGKFTIKLRKGSFSELLSEYGLVGTANLKNNPVNVPVALMLAETLYQKYQPQLYSAKQGKSGATKDAK